MNDFKTAIQLKVVTFNGNTDNPVKLNKRQQAAVDEFVNRQVGAQLNELADNVPALVQALVNTKK